MKKFIYGIFDIRTHNFGDICILDRDEEFRDGCISLFSNPDIPDYILNDLIGVRYGSVSFDDATMYPKFDMDAIPVTIIYGHDVIPLRKNEKVDVNDTGYDVDAIEPPDLDSQFCAEEDDI